MLDPNEMKKGGFAASAELQRQRQAARVAKDRDVGFDASAVSELTPVPVTTPTVNGGAPIPQPLPTKETKAPATKPETTE